MPSNDDMIRLKPTQGVFAKVPHSGIKLHHLARACHEGTVYCLPTEWQGRPVMVLLVEGPSEPGSGRVLVPVAMLTDEALNEELIPGSLAGAYATSTPIQMTWTVERNRLREAVQALRPDEAKPQA
jgi:hypothetical protein